MAIINKIIADLGLKSTRRTRCSKFIKDDEACTLYLLFFLCCLCSRTPFSDETWKVVVYFNPEENLDSIRVYSKSASLISPNLYNAADDIQCAVDGSNDLTQEGPQTGQMTQDFFWRTVTAK